jgi:hypothetical protein
MFIQVVQGKVKDADHWRRELRRWRTELKPKAKGYLGTTSGVTPDGRAIALFRFESEKDARANSALAVQGKWWKEAAKAFDGKVTVHNCKDVDTVVGGGSNWAGFVQVVQGRAKNQQVMRRRMSEMESRLRTVRPDILGVVVAWHGDGGFTQAVYFTSAQAAREREAARQDDEMDREYAAFMDGPPMFFDLLPPDFD